MEEVNERNEEEKRFLQEYSPEIFMRDLLEMVPKSKLMKEENVRVFGLYLGTAPIAQELAGLENQLSMIEEYLSSA